MSQDVVAKEPNSDLKLYSQKASNLLFIISGGKADVCALCGDQPLRAVSRKTSQKGQGTGAAAPTTLQPLAEQPLCDGNAAEPEVAAGPSSGGPSIKRKPPAAKQARRRNRKPYPDSDDRYLHP